MHAFTMRQPPIGAAELTTNITMSSSSSSVGSPQSTSTFYDVIASAKREAFRGGVAGASAQVINVFSLMWLRTTMNYQYRYGGNMKAALNTLYKDGTHRLFQ